MKKILIAITGLFLITSLTINAQTHDKKVATEKKMSCCMNKGTMTAADSAKCKEMKNDSSKCKMKCSEMKTAMKCDPAKCKDMAKK
jgi:hypothetical protein